MRTALRAAMTLVTACAITPTLGTPAGAVTTCPGGEPVCLYIPAGDYPIPNPAPVTVDQPVTRVPLPRVCDSNGDNCTEGWIDVPGYYANSTGSTLWTVHFPGAGVGINGALVTVYVSRPTTSPGDWSGATLRVAVDKVPVEVEDSPLTFSCEDSARDYGVVSYNDTACVVTVQVKTH